MGGHLIKMHNDKIPKGVLDAKLDGKGKITGPKLRWLEEDKADLKVTEIKGCRSEAQTDQNEWMSLGRLR